MRVRMFRRIVFQPCSLNPADAPIALRSLREFHGPAAKSNPELFHRVAPEQLLQRRVAYRAGPTQTWRYSRLDFPTQFRLHQSLPERHGYEKIASCPQAELPVPFHPREECARK